MTRQNAFLAYDIETVANERATTYFQGKKYDAPRNYKDPAKIEEYILERRHEDMQKAALRWWTGKVIAISCTAVNATLKGSGPKTKVFLGETERDVLRAFFDLLTAYPDLTPIGKHGDTFDKPFLIGRSMVHDIGIPQALRPYRPIEDVNHIFSFSQHCDQRGTLDDYAFGLGITQKKGKGSDIAYWHQAAIMGDDSAWKQIADYCAHDTEITAELVRRYIKPYRDENPPAPDQTADLLKDTFGN